MVVQISSDYWKSLSGKDLRGIPYLELLAVKSGCTVEDIIEEIFLQPKRIPLKFAFPKREKQKLKSVWKIVSSLPATLSVLERKTKLSRNTLYKYLKKLEDIKVVVKMYDSTTDLQLYWLHDGLMREKAGKNEILWRAILNRWFHLPEYTKKDKIFYEALKGRRKIQGKITKAAKRARKRKVEKIKKQILKNSRK